MPSVNSLILNTTLAENKDSFKGLATFSGEAALPFPFFLPSDWSQLLKERVCSFTFLCDEQDTISRAVLYLDRSCFCLLLNRVLLLKDRICS